MSTTLSVTLVSTAVVVAAVQSDGASATDVNLNDGSVWVTNDDRVGRLNIRIRELDFARRAAIGSDVLQDYRTVYFTGQDGGVQRLDTLSGQATGSNEAEIANYRLRGQIALLFDPADGKLWVGPSTSMVGNEYPKNADAQIEPESLVAIGSRSHEPGQPRPIGNVFVVDSSGWWTLALDDSGKPVRPEPEESDEGSDGDSTTTTSTTTEPEPAEDGSLPEPPPEPIAEPEINQLPVPFSEIAEVTTVGERLAVLTNDGRVGGMSSEPVEVPGSGHVLQQPGYESDTVLVASTAGLFSVPLDGGLAEEITAASGTPARPVLVGPCAYGAWSGDEPSFFKACGGQIVNPVTPIPNATPDVELVWRVNGPNIALNSPGDGGVWADHEGTLSFAGNWSDVEADNEDSDEQEDTTGESLRVVEKKCKPGTDLVPRAGNDELGVRPRQSILDVLNNDDDENCEPIAITQVIPSTDFPGQLTIIDNGQHILYSPDSDIQQLGIDDTATFEFQYLVSDAAGNTSEPATVVGIVKGTDINVSPELLPKSDDTTRTMKTVVEAGRAVTHNVMADWWDPDGDDLRLVSAIALEEGEVSATPDGVVRFAAFGVAPGVYNVEVTMSDGRLASRENLEVTVKPTGSAIPPVVEHDFVTVNEGQSATVTPLANDSDPNEDNLELVPGWLPDEQGKYRTALQGGEVTITGLEQGTYRLPYEASDGDDTTTGYIWLTVRGPGEGNRPPIGVPDEVKIRANRVINVDVLANDIDLDGDILAVTRAQVDAAPDEIGAVKASIVDRRLVQIEVVPGPTGAPPTGPFTIRYSIDDGFTTVRLAEGQTQEEEVAASLRATGAITVLVQPTGEDQPPLLEPDRATVRSGDVVRVAVLRNDRDPDADELVLTGVDAEQAAEIEASGQGLVWTQGRYVYFKGGTPGRVSVIYTAVAAGKRATSEVVFQVTPLPDTETNPNQAPTPPDIEVRAIRNGEVRVPVELFGVDPDGDSVRLLDDLSGLSGSAEGNRVRLDPENPDAILFQAGDAASPTDSFTYTVRDPFGLVGTGTVSVMVIDDEGWPPQAFDDVFVGKPGRTLSIPVLANDNSPQDRALEIDAEPFFNLDGQPVTEPVNTGAVTLLDQQSEDTRGRVNVVVPNDGSTLTEHYRITDGRAPASAYIRVSADPDVPNVPPVATPDEVTVDDIDEDDIGRIDVLVNDYDPDDVGGGLVLDLPDSQAVTSEGEAITVDGSELVIPLTEFAQTVLYRITDSDGAIAVGYVRVPGKENQPPVLSAAGRDVNNRRIEAASPSPLNIPLTSIVEDPDGDPDIRLTASEVLVLGGLGSVRRADDNSGFVFTPPDELRDSRTIAIEFEVTDRPEKTVDERAEPNCNCVARLVVEVLIEAASPPRVLSPGSVSVPQLDEEVSYDLAPLTVDDQNDPLTYELDPSSFGGLEISLAGSTIILVSRLAEDEKLPLGSVIPLRYTVSDGGFDPVENIVNVQIIATNRGQVVAGVFPLQEAERDEVYDLPNLLTAASNPFPDRPLRLVEPSVDGGAQVTCSEDGSCQFLSNTVGDFTVTYVVQDAVDQTSVGTIAVQVKGKPRAPGVPSIESVGDHVVNLAWSEADMQGGEFSHYVVTAVETGQTKQFPTTGGEFDNLENARPYTFTVYAVNELGDGEVSRASSPGIPDRVPDPPVGARIVDYGDQFLVLEWDAPPTAGDFSAILAYEVSIGGQRVRVDAPATTVRVGAGGQGSPLINGTDYEFSVRAQNSATVDNGWGAFSAVSGSERPSRYPDPPTGVSAANTGDGGQPRLTVSWSAPGFDGGRSILNYQVCQAGTSTCQTVTGTSATFDLPRNQTVRYVVVAFNSDKNRDNSDPSAASPAATTVGNPDTPTVRIASSGDKTITASASTTNGSGCSSYTIEYSINGGASWQTSGIFSSGLVNGTAYSIISRVTLNGSCGSSGVTYRSGESSAASATPYGPLVAPTIRANRSGNTVSFSWSTNRADDGRPGWTARLSGTGAGCSGTVSGSGTTPAQDIGYEATRTCTITISAQGAASISREATVTTPNPPPRTINLSQGPVATSPGATQTCTDQGFTCWNVNISGSNFLPNAALQVRCEGDSRWFALTTTNGSGSFGTTRSVCFNDGRVGQTIWVRDSAGQASGLSRWR